MEEKDYKMTYRKLAVCVVMALLAASGAGVIAQSAQDNREALEVVWSDEFATENKDAVKGVSFDADDNCFVVGRVQGSVAEPNQGDCDIVVAKYNAEGVRQWIHQFGGPNHEEPEGIATDVAGNCYIVSDTYGNMFENVMAEPDKGSRDNVVLVKYDGDGKQVWGVQINSGGADLCYDMATDAEGSCYVVGETTGRLGDDNKGEEDAFIARFTSDGELSWVRQLGTTYKDRATCVAVDGEGNCYVGGATEGDLEGDNKGQRDIFVAKYDSAGERLWLRQYGTAGDEMCSGVAVDEETECFYAVGFSGGDMVGDYAGGQDAFVIQFDCDGTWLWGRSIGSSADDAANTVAADAEGCYVGGKAGWYLGDSYIDGAMMFLAKFNLDGERQWLHQFGPVNGYAALISVEVDSTGNCAMGGFNVGDFNVPNKGGEDGFVMKVIHESDKE